MVIEFFTGVVTDKRAIPENGNEEDFYVFMCGKEVVISAETIGEMLNIEYIDGDSKPPKNFDYDAAWRFISRKDEDMPTTESQRKLLQSDVKQEMICGYGILIAMLGKAFSIKSHEHKDLKAACSHFSDVTQGRFVRTVTKDTERLQAIKELKTDIQGVTRAQNKLTRESKIWREEITTMLILLIEKVTGKKFGVSTSAVTKKAAVSKKDLVEVSSSNDDKEKSEEQKESEEE